MSIKHLFSLCIVAAVVFFAQQKNVVKKDIFFTQNLEALSSGESGDHGQIDQTLEPYKRLSSYYYTIPDLHMGPTKIPCCEPDESPLSGCARGLDDCP